MVAVVDAANKVTGLFTLHELLRAQHQLADKGMAQAIGVNPFSIEEIAQGVHEALTMSPRWPQRRMHLMRDQVAHQNM